MPSIREAIVKSDHAKQLDANYNKHDPKISFRKDKAINQAHLADIEVRILAWHFLN